MKIQMNEQNQHPPSTLRDALDDDTPPSEHFFIYIFFFLTARPAATVSSLGRANNIGKSSELGRRQRIIINYHCARITLHNKHITQSWWCTTRSVRSFSAVRNARSSAVKRNTKSSIEIKYNITSLFFCPITFAFKRKNANTHKRTRPL